MSWYRLNCRNKEKERLANRERRRRSIHQAQLIVGRGKMICSQCGISDKLSINHDNGDGWKDRRSDFYWAIINGKRKIDDLSLRCRKCHNMFHNYGLGIPDQAISHGV